MSNRDGFDLYPTIAYQDIETLFWKKYPYKVVVKDSMERPPEMSGWEPEKYDQWRKHYQERQKFYYARKRHCPEDKNVWKSLNSGTSYSFFFVNETDVLNFVKKNREFITKVFRPCTQEQVDVLKTNNKLVLRNYLYYGKYRFCIEFKDTVNEEQLDTSVNNIFYTPNVGRFQYSYSKRRRLFLNDEKDVIFVKLALHQQIRSISQAILKEEI